MACLRDALAQTLTHGYANHIQRLMVTGLYALMLGVQATGKYIQRSERAASIRRGEVGVGVGGEQRG